MSEDSEHCYYCEASHERLKLAEALESGRYQQLPPAERNSGLLRDPEDRYSVTGVATAELAPTIWVKTTDMWAAYPLEHVLDILPKTEGNVKAEYPDPGEDFARKMEETGAGTVTGCPEETACALGLHEPDNSSHPDPIEVNAYLLSPDEREAAGIPRDWDRPYQLDLLEFKVAANIIRRFQNSLIGHCNADAED